MEDNQGTGEGTGTGAATGHEQQPAWQQQLPKDLIGNEAFTGFKTLGDVAKNFIELKGKASEADGLKARLEGAIFKPGKDAKPEEISAYQKAMGVPEKPEEYEFPKGEGTVHDEQMVTWARDVFHKAGLTKDQGAVLSQAWDGFIQGISQADKEATKKGIEDANKTLDTKWGAEKEKNLEITRRGFAAFEKVAPEFKSLLESTVIDGIKLGNHPAMMEGFFALGKIIGEDFTLPSAQQRTAQATPGIIYDKSPPPPKNQ